MSNARWSNSNKMEKQLADVYKLKGNWFYAEMIQDLERHKNTYFTLSPKTTDKAFTSPSEETYEIKIQNVDAKRPY